MTNMTTYHCEEGHNGVIRCTPATGELIARRSAAACSPSSECPGPTHYAGCACHEKGWQNKWECAVEMAAQAECKLDEARKMHAYANEQRKAADNARMNAEETVARLREKVDELLKHGKDACEYTDGWDDALLKVRDEFPPENAGAVAPPPQRPASGKDVPGG